MSVCVIQENGTINGKAFSRNIIKKSKEEMNEALQEMAKEAKKQGFECEVIAPGNVLKAKKGNMVSEMIAYEARELELEPLVFVNTYRFSKSICVEVLHDNKAGFASVYIFDENNTSVKQEVVRIDTRKKYICDSEAIAIAMPSIDAFAKNRYGEIAD